MLNNHLTGKLYILQYRQLWHPISLLGTRLVHVSVGLLVKAKQVHTFFLSISVCVCESITAYLNL